MSENKIRVVMLNYPGIFSALVRQILAQAPNIEMVGLVYSARIFSKNENWLQGAIRMIAQSGIRYALLQFMQTDLFCLVAWLLKKLGENGLPLLHTKDVNNPESQAFIKALNPDVLLMANFNQKLHPPVIALPNVACLNIHPGLLPDFQGVDPVFAALHAGATRLGVTLHHVTPEFDTGEWVAQAEIPVTVGRSAFWHQFRLFKLGAELAAEQIGRLPQPLARQRQKGDGRYDSWPSGRQVAEFKSQGGRLIGIRDYVAAVKSVVTGRVGQNPEHWDVIAE